MMNRNRPQGRGGGRPQGRGGGRGQGGGGILSTNVGRQRPQALNSGAGILGDGPSMMAMGENTGQFKQPQSLLNLSPQGGMRNISPGMQNVMRPAQQQRGNQNVGNQLTSAARESQLQMMNNLLLKQQQQINAGRASLLGNVDSNRSSLLGSSMERNFQGTNLGDRNRRNEDLMSDGGFSDMGRRSLPLDVMSSGDGRGGSNYIGQSFGRSTSREDEYGHDDRRSRSYDDYPQDNEYHGGRSSLLRDNDSVGRGSLLGGLGGLSDMSGRDDMSRSSLGNHGNFVSSSGVGILDNGGGSLLSNMQQAILGPTSKMPSLMGQGGNMQSLMGQQSGNRQSLMGQHGGSMQGRNSQGLLGPGGNMQGIMGQGPQLGGQTSIPSLFDIGTNKRGGLLGKRVGRGGRDQLGQKRFRRNSGPSSQDSRRQGNRNDRSSDGRGRSRGTDRRHDRQDRTSSNDRRNQRDSESSKSRDSDKKSHSSDRKSNEKSKSHDVDKKKSADKDEPIDQYDPSEPTEDDEAGTALNEKKDKDVEMIDLTTEKPADKSDKEETTTSTPSKNEDVPDTTMTVTIDSKGRIVNDSALVKKESKEGMTSPKVKGKFFCHACMVECHDFEGFARHMKGKKHLNRMQSLGSAHIQVSEQQMSRLKAEEHLRSFEKKPRSEDRNRRGDISQRRGSTDRRFYGRGQLYTPQQPPPAVLDSFRSPQTRSSFRNRPNQGYRDRHSRRDRDHDESSNASFPGDLGDMVTVDEVGFEDQDESVSQELEENAEKKNEESKEPKKPAPEDADDYVIPDYDPKTPVGQNYVVPVSGYFCKLCHKFYTTEAAAKTSHCMSKPHYDKFHDAMMNKLMAKVLSKTEDEKEKDKGNETVSSNKEVKKSSTENLEKSKAAATSQRAVNGKKEENSEEKLCQDTTDKSIKPEADKQTVMETDNEEPEEKNEQETSEEDKNNADEEEGLTVTVSNVKNKAIKKVALKAKRGKKT